MQAQPCCSGPLPTEMATEDEQLKKELEDVTKKIEGYKTRTAASGGDKELDKLLEKNLAALREKKVLLMEGVCHPPLHQQLDGNDCFQLCTQTLSGPVAHGYSGVCSVLACMSHYDCGFICMQSQLYHDLRMDFPGWVRGWLDCMHWDFGWVVRAQLVLMGR